MSIEKEISRDNVLGKLVEHGIIPPFPEPVSPPVPDYIPEFLLQGRKPASKSFIDDSERNLAEKRAVMGSKPNAPCDPEDQAKITMPPRPIRPESRPEFIPLQERLREANLESLSRSASERKKVSNS